MKMTGHTTEAVHRRYAITDSAMLQGPRSNFSHYTQPKGTAKVQPKLKQFRSLGDVNPLHNVLDFQYLSNFARVAEWQTRRT